MEVIGTLSELARVPEPIVLAIGVFDGVHLAHQAVLRRALEDAVRIGGAAVVLTFDPHPARILRPDSAPHLLTSTAHKLELLAKLGIPWVVLHRFDAAFAAQAPEEFVASLFEAKTALREVCVGENWTFGRDRSGTVDLLRRFGEHFGLGVVEIPQILVDGLPVSSTRIRKAIAGGDFDEARKCLGRDYTILGTVEHGSQLGHQLGFPTANLRAHNEQFPPDGVYVVRVDVGEAIYGGVANIGVRPTIPGVHERTLEVHLLDFDRDLYGRNLDVEFVAYLRGEQKFLSLDALREQIQEDVCEARRVLTR